MPTEDRFITFTFPEVYEALVIRAKLTDSELPTSASVTKVDLAEDQSVFTLTYEASEQPQNFEAGFFVLALVFFCNSNGIPIPKANKKMMHVQPDGIVMRIQL